MSNTIAIWFESATALFEVFLEAKFELYGAAAAGSEPATVLLSDAHLRTAPTEFADDVERIVWTAFEGLPSGFDAATELESAQTETLYGELSTLGIRQVASIAAAAATAADPCHRGRITFWDLGSGTGRVVIEVLLLLSTQLHARDDVVGSSILWHAVGVEFCKARHDVATAGLARLTAIAPSLLSPTFFGGSPIKLIFGDFLEAGLLGIDGVEDDVVAFCCGVGFSAEQCLAILRRLHQLGDRLLAAVLLLRSVPEDDVLLGPLTRSKYSIRQVRLSTTWMSEAPATVIGRTAA